MPYSTSSLDDNAQNAGNTQQVSQSGQKQITIASGGVQKWPGARSYNPLSEMSSSTYNISLYVTTSEIGNKFVQGGGTMAGINPLNDPIYVVAQSGGTNKSLENKISPAGLDYYIDDLTITTVMPNTQGKSATATTELKFKIYEPTGFSFLKDLSAASHQLNRQSNMVKGIQPKFEPELQNQFYILGIKFTGYDANGLPVKASDPIFSDYNNGYASENSVIERYFAIVMASIKFTLDGKMVTYNCVAKPISENEAYGEMNAVLKKSETLYGSTIYDVLMGGTDQDKTKNRGLAKALNDMNESFKDQKILKIPNKYNFQFLDADGKDVGKESPIAKGKIYNQSTVTNSSAPTSNATNSASITIKDTVTSNSIDKTRVQVAINQGQNIVAVLDNLITKSTYISDCLNSVSTEVNQTITIKNPVTKDINWFSINPVVTRVGRNVQLNNWAYEITYQIRPFTIPYIISTYVDTPIKFPGTFKEYEYWLTGKNSEVISYSQEYNNLYYQPLPVSGGAEEVVPTGRGTDVKIVPSGTPGSTDTHQSAQNRGSQNNESVRVSLYSHADNSQVKIKIMGDPDYLMTGLGVNNTGLPQYYGNGFTINPNSGQVFIRINFRTADDYKSDGTLNILGPIRFYEADVGENAAPEGLIYMVVNVESTFVRGAFIQTLQCVMAPEDSLVIKKNTAKTEDRQQERVTKAPAPAPISGGLGRGRGGPTAEELAAYNNRPPPSVDLRKPMSSLAKGNEAILNPDRSSATPTLTQLTSSPAYIAARRSGQGGQQALNTAREAWMANLSNDDQAKASPSQQSAPRTNNNQRPTTTGSR
jgi:hypothetical protein